MSKDASSKTRAPIPLPSAEFLRECLRYNPKNGDLHWKKRPLDHFIGAREWIIWNKRFASNVAGSILDTGYIKITIDGRVYLAHRIVWKLMTGEEPPDQIDHRDGSRINNAITNLRAATQTEQKYNKRFRLKNISGYRGVYITARIKIPGGIMRNLGSFATPEEASAAYEAAARDLHGAFYFRNPKD